MSDYVCDYCIEKSPCMICWTDAGFIPQYFNGINVDLVNQARKIHEAKEKMKKLSELIEEFIEEEDEKSEEI